MREKGTDAWFTEPLEAFWPEGYVYEPTGESRPEQFEKEFDILDVWFDSGATSIAVCEARPGLKRPASLYLEGSDQHRGWFQSSLLVGIGTRDQAPYEACLTHGFVLDEKGEAMSKSKGNVISGCISRRGCAAGERRPSLLRGSRGLAAARGRHQHRTGVKSIIRYPEIIG